MSKVFSFHSHCGLRASFAPQTPLSSSLSSSNLIVRSMPAGFRTLKACVDETPTESAASSLKKVFIIKPNQDGFAVILEITSAESVMVQESEETTMDKTVSTITMDIAPKKPETKVELLEGGRHILSKYLEDDLKKTLGKVDLVKLLQIAGLVSRFPWLARFVLGWQFMWFLFKLYLFASSFSKDTNKKGVK